MPIPTTPPYPPLSFSLPKVSFRKIPPSEALELSVPAGVHERQHVEYGFNNGAEYVRPEHYLRFIEPVEAELKNRVEYDMDEQDQEWLDQVNAERKRSGMDTISYEVFEILVDRIEKEWFDLMKRVPKKTSPSLGQGLADSVEDTRCAICDDGECENSNAIVFCDGCNLAAHQDCYGIPYIPEGQWLCRKCTVSPDRAISCILCPHEGGAFKQTSNGKWAHLLCAIWIPETGVSNPVYMEPIDGVEQIPKARWKLQCYLCRQRVGACIQCDNRNCCTAFHVTCAREAGLLLKFNRQRADPHGHGTSTALGSDTAHAANISLSDDEDTGPEVLRACCGKHLPKEVREERERLGIAFPLTLNLRADGDDTPTASRASTPGGAGSDIFDRSTLGSQRKKGASRAGPSAVNGHAHAQPPNGNAQLNGTTSKAARAYKKSYRAGPPLLPKYVTDRIFEYTHKIRIRGKQQFVAQLARFWSLKREARRGAPLLKRLHLEPWTASPIPKEQAETEKERKLEYLRMLRQDLESLRLLADLSLRREQEKAKQIEVLKSTLVDQLLLPHVDSLRKAFQEISSLDRQGLFAQPVSAAEVPDYYDIIKKPMDWSLISARVDANTYGTIADFESDIKQVTLNARLYNKPDTPYHKLALKIEKAAGPIFAALHAKVASMHGVENTNMATAVQAWTEEQDSIRLNGGTALSQEDLERLLERLGPDLTFHLESELSILKVVEEPDLCAQASLVKALLENDESRKLADGDNADAHAEEKRLNLFDNIILQALAEEPSDDLVSSHETLASPAVPAEAPEQVSSRKRKIKVKRARSEAPGADEPSKRRRKEDAGAAEPAPIAEFTDDVQGVPMLAPIEDAAPPAPSPSVQPSSSPELVAPEPVPASVPDTAPAISPELPSTRKSRARRASIRSDTKSPNIPAEVDMVPAAEVDDAETVPAETVEPSEVVKDGDAPGSSSKTDRTPSVQASPHLPNTPAFEAAQSEPSGDSLNDDSILAQRRKLAGIVPTTLEVQDVSPWDTFKRFETGWVLPEGTKRHSRPSNLKENHVSLDRRPKEVANRVVSKDKQSIIAVQSQDEGTSDAIAGPSSERMNALEAREYDNSSDLTSIGGDSSELSEDETMDEDNNDGDDQDDEERAKAAAAQRRRRARAQRRRELRGGDVEDDQYVRDSNGRFASGTKQKKKKKKKKALRKSKEAESESEAEQPEAAAATAESAAADSDSEALSELSEDHEEEKTADVTDGMERSQSAMSETFRASHNKGDRGSRGRRGRVKVPRVKALGEGEPEEFVDGTMVWAKMSGFPFSPAVIVEPEKTRDEVPLSVLEGKRGADQVHLVHFYDHKSSWSWLATRNLRFMFDYEEVDKALLKAPDARTQHLRNQVREQYNLARSFKA
ncbi:hypothetical protein OC846_004812 [Tilletia horrida]|uniref:Uncharacterized protein n=1 Tax=Tilletia horrida TaxID=155126 RepID=A0AAN6GRQ2_9BASI|nr:hypothetical protein OC846_004812 [Tilletia horrida]